MNILTQPMTIVTQLIESINQLPENWALTPVKGKKAYRKQWSSEKPLDREKIIKEITQKRATGIGLRTGEVSGGILAIDVDGPSAQKLLRKLSQGKLPKTISFKSGKPGRGQLLYSIPQEYWEIMKTTKLTADANEQLEFRWNGCQSVLPPSTHPETGQYTWIKSPQEIQISEAPLWIIELMLNDQNDQNSMNSSFIDIDTQRIADIGRPPLEIFLGRDDRNLVNNGISEGNRNIAAQKLSINLVATARRLRELGIDFEGDPRELYDQFCSRCNPPLGSDVRGEADGWWKNVEKVAKRPSLDDEKIQGCYRAWERRQMAKNRASANSSIPQPQASTQVSTQVSSEKSHLKDNIMPILNGEAVYTDDERFRLALLELSQETDRISYIRKRAKICSFYRVSKSEIEELIRYTQQKTRAKNLKKLSLNDLFDMEIEELTWLIPELLPKGEMVILAGPPKCGKTSMAIDAAFSIATGEQDFLGLRPSVGRVLLISNDENPRSTRSKLMKRGFNRNDINLEIIFNWDIGQLYELEEVLDDFRPDLVIIDSLKSITANNAEISENSAEFANNIYILKNLFNKYNAASILIHHTNKNKEAMGVAKLRGSSAIAGAVWGTWQLEHVPKQNPESKGLIIDPSDPKRTLSVFARDIEGQLISLEFNPENNSFKRIDEEIISERQKLSQKILKLLKMYPNGLTGTGIIENLGLTPEEGRSVYTTLSRMEAKLLISTTKSDIDKRINLYKIKNIEEVEKILSKEISESDGIIEFTAEEIAAEMAARKARKKDATPEPELEPTTPELEPTTPELEPTTRELEPTTRELEPTTRELEPTTRELHEKMFKSGDLVTILEPFHFRYKQIGEIKLVTSENVYKVKWPDGAEHLYQGYELTSLSEGTTG